MIWHYISSWFAWRLFKLYMSTQPRRLEHTYSCIYTRSSSFHSTAFPISGSLCFLQCWILKTLINTPCFYDPGYLLIHTQAHHHPLLPPSNQWDLHQHNDNQHQQCCPQTSSRCERVLHTQTCLVYLKYHSIALAVPLVPLSEELVTVPIQTPGKPRVTNTDSWAIWWRESDLSKLGAKNVSCGSALSSH